jgi:hypothetical protein
MILAIVTCIIVEHLLCDMVQCADMIKRQIAIMVVVMMCIAPFSGSFAVVCHGEDGHVAIEIAVHDHCDEGDTKASHGYDEQQAYGTGGHGHCDDVAIKSDIAVSAKRKDLTNKSKVFANNLHSLKDSNPRNSEFKSCFGRNVESTSFFTPLSTIILLA